MGAASAADENITDSAGDVLAVDSVDTGELEVNTGDFAELQSLVDNTSSEGILKLDKDYANEASNFVNYINVTKSITIDGQGHTIDAKQSGKKIFYITSCQVSFINISFVNSGGSAIHCYNSRSACIVNDCSFINCRDNSSGGAICSVIVNNCHVYNCSFINCYAYFSAGAIRNGQAYDCSFINCSSAASGGAMYWGSATNCTFRDCHAGEGGAAYHVAVTCSSFINCSAGIGGAIYLLSPTDCSFVDCYSIRAGGAVFSGNAKRCYFRNCTTEYTKAAICGGSATKCTFVDCQASAAINFVISVDVYRGSTATVIVIGESDAGNVELTVNGKTQKVTPSPSGRYVSFSGLPAGTYQAKATFHGNDKYEAQSITITVFVMDDPITRIHVSPSYPSDNGQIEFTYSQSRLYVQLESSYIPGNITVKINNVTYLRYTYGRSFISFSLGIMKPGTYDILVSYAGSDFFKAQSVKFTFSVVKANPIGYIELSPYGYTSSDACSRQRSYDAKDTSLDIYLKSDRISGNVHVTVNGASHKVFAVNGKNSILNIPIGILNIGENVIKVTYAGSAYFDAQEVSFTINVLKATPIKSVEKPDSYMAYGENATIRVNMQNNNINGNVWFTISDGNKTKLITDKMKIVNGVASVSIPDLGIGSYFLHIYFAGNVHYEAQTIKKNFWVVNETDIIHATIEPLN